MRDKERETGYDGKLVKTILAVGHTSVRSHLTCRCVRVSQSLPKHSCVCAHAVCLCAGEKESASAVCVCVHVCLHTGCG